VSLVREFNTNGHIQAPAASAYAFSNLTFCCYANCSGTGNQWLNSYTGAGARITLGIEGGVVKLYKGGGSNGPAAISGWALYVVTKASGSVKPLFYIYDFEAEEWVADGTAGSINMTDGPSEAPANIELGIWEGPGSEQFEGQMAADAIWKRVLSKAEVHELVTLGNVEAWEALEPDARWRFDEALPEDQTGGGADVTSVSGTELVEETIPLPYGEGEEPPPGGNTVQVKDGGELVTAKRWVKQGGILVPA
jgi:hypothetical protein